MDNTMTTTSKTPLSQEAGMARKLKHTREKYKMMMATAARDPKTKKLGSPDDFDYYKGQFDLNLADKRDDVEGPIGINGQQFYFKRGEDVIIPGPVLKQAQRCGVRVFNIELVEAAKKPEAPKKEDEEAANPPAEDQPKNKAGKAKAGKAADE